MTNTVNLTIDNQKMTVEKGTTVLQATQLKGIEVPTFCYHAKLSIAGNCRMCLVEIEGQRKPVASCAMPCEEGMVVHTTTPFVKESRAGALEFLLLHHPLDCPICDQGGECDLQDITIAYGQDKSRYGFYKRAVPQKEFGPLIKTEMNRCIHCTRCVRFATEVAGMPNIGAFYRGEHTEIVSLLDKPFASELSGNIIDLCPVGALTSKPYAYKGRPWELSKRETIDVMDAVGSHIRVDTRGLEVMRILPRAFDPINEEWISDKTRFAFDGLKKQRLDRAYVKDHDGILREASWDEALLKVSHTLKEYTGPEMAGIAGDMVEVESVYLFKKLMDHLKVPHIDCRQDGAKLLSAPRCSYIMNTPIERLEEADYALLIGTNPRREAPLINARLRKAYAHGVLEVSAIGPLMDLTYPFEHLGDHPRVLEKILDGTHPVCEKLKKASKPVIILGQAPLRRKDGGRFLHMAHKIADKYKLVTPNWCGFNVLQTAAGRVGGMDVGFVPQKNGKNVAEILSAAAMGTIKVVYLLAADELDVYALKDTFVIYQGHHGDKGAEVADVILPSAAYTEKDGLYVNAEGRPQYAYQACPPPGEARLDTAILGDLLKATGSAFRFDNLDTLRHHLFEDHPHLGHVGDVPTAPFQSFLKDIKPPESFENEPLQPAIENFYQTDPISRNSATMAQCARTFLKDTENL